MPSTSIGVIVDVYLTFVEVSSNVHLTFVEVPLDIYSFFHWILVWCPSDGSFVSSDDSFVPFHSTTFPFHLTVVLFCLTKVSFRPTKFYPPCPQMMRALSLNQSLGISYEVTHNPLSRFLWAHDLRNGTIKCLQHHCHPLQLLWGIQVQTTLHQRYIRIYLKGLISGVFLLLHQLSHQHHIFCCKSWPLHQYTPCRSIVPLEKSKSLTEG